ncbi:MAG: DUF928 domain-containing protein [Oscillatoria sp. PMC 1068.18]|nr:DUF928 domain-containing protein [Oscillatoria sp. PMC 1076.18]MEC4990693.1 DUF928 domain-containing protein [Oscillatoria sp. PMC 1068.18]
MQSSSQSNSPDSGPGAPGRTERGGPRNPCPATKPLTPIVFTGDRGLKGRLSAEEHPTFWVYVPYPSDRIESATFSLRSREDNEEEHIVYETNLNIRETPGIIRISIPSTEEPLQLNNWYRWYLFVDVYCDENSPASKDRVYGWVRREQLDSPLPNTATPQEKAFQLAKNGFLYDAVTILAEVNDLQGIQNLLNNYQLETIANEPLVDCCTTENEALP